MFRIFLLDARFSHCLLFTRNVRSTVSNDNLMSDFINLIPKGIKFQHIMEKHLGKGLPCPAPRPKLKYLVENSSFIAHTVNHVC